MRALRILGLCLGTLLLILTVSNRSITLAGQDFYFEKITVNVHVADCQTKEDISGAKVTIHNDPETYAEGYTNDEGNFSAIVGLWIPNGMSETDGVLKYIQAEAEKQGYGSSRTVSKIAVTLPFIGTVLNIELCLPREGINLVFLHGFASSSSAMVLVRNNVIAGLRGYQLKDNLGSYPNNVDVKAWAFNIGQRVNVNFPGKEKNVVLIGHSMGGKAAVYAVAHNSWGIANKVAMIFTYNTPYHRLDRYQVNYRIPEGIKGGCRTILKVLGIGDRGVCESLATYDSVQDAANVRARGIPIYALFSGESEPLSNACNRLFKGKVSLGLDLYPSDRDDGFVPLDAQVVDGTTGIFYGPFCHTDHTEPDVAKTIANWIVARIVQHFGK